MNLSHYPESGSLVHGEPSTRSAASRVLYFVMAHKSPSQTKRMLHALLAASQTGIILLHYDPASPALDLEELAGNARVHVMPTPRLVRWSDFSMVDAFLASMRWALTNLEFEWMVWLSGQDYPLGTLHTFEHGLANNTHDGYFRYFEVLGHPGWPPGEGLRRYFYRYVALPRNPYFYRLPAAVKSLLGKLRKWFVKRQPWVMLWPRQRNNPAKLGLRRSRTPFSPAHPCMGGWMWLNIRRRCVAYLVDYAATHPGYVRYYRSTYCPEESFAHSVLLNAGSFEFVNLPLRHIHWGATAFPSSPRAITLGEELERALAGDSPFARKFDQDVDAQPLDILDARIRDGVPAPCRMTV